MSSKTSLKYILGTFSVGDPNTFPGIGIVHFDTEQDVKQLLDAFYNRGYRDIDTARNYGASEARLGKAEITSQLNIHTKVRSGPPGAHEPSKINMSIKESLDALQVSKVETMFLHSPDRQTPFEDTLKAINNAFIEGKFNKFGISNYSVGEVIKILEICEKYEYIKPSVYQGQYNAIVRGGEEELFPLLRKNNIAFFGFSPALGGLLSDHVSTSRRWKDETIVGKVYVPFYSHPSVQDSAATIKAIAQKYGISGHAAALRWTAFHSLLDGNYGDGLIFGVSKIEHLNESLDALESGPLPAELAESISAIYPIVAGNEPPFHL